MAGNQRASLELFAPRRDVLAMGVGRTENGDCVRRPDAGIDLGANRPRYFLTVTPFICSTEGKGCGVPSTSRSYQPTNVTSNVAVPALLS